MIMYDYAKLIKRRKEGRSGKCWALLAITIFICADSIVEVLV